MVFLTLTTTQHKNYSSDILLLSDTPRLNGTQLNYYFVCKRKLWLFSHDITFESSSELVSLGRLVHKDSYKRKKKEIRIGDISIDHIDKDVIHEVKKSDKIHEAHEFQLLYYIYCLKKLGVHKTGILDYPKLKKIVKVVLTQQKQRLLESVICDTSDVINAKRPPPAEYKPICDKCAYAEYCWS